MKTAYYALGFVLLILQWIWNRAQPEVASELALQQFADPSLVVDTAMRTSLWPIVWSLYTFVLIIILFKSLSKEKTNA